MPFARPNLTRPLPRPIRPSRRRPIQLSGGLGATLPAVLGGTNFLARVWISFDPPNTPLPTWIEITGFVETESAISITRGRSDGLGDVNAATVSLTVDNSDGRFAAGNPNGAWYGLIRKGSWLKVDVLPASGLVSDRFVGFVTTLPTGWSGQYATATITASDRYEKFGNAPALLSMVEHEVLTDPNLAGNVKGYWNLHEQQGSLTFGDTSGQGARHLAAVACGGVPVGTGFAAGNVAGPGFDGLRAATFNPLNTAQGTCLMGQIAVPTGSWAGTVYSGLLGTVEFWFQAVTTGVRQILLSLVDQGAQFGFTLLIDVSGYIAFSGASTVPTNAASFGTAVATMLPRVDDGKWHQVVFAAAATGTSGGSVRAALVLDGGVAVPAGGGFGLGVGGGNLTQLVVGGGYDALAPGAITLGASNMSDVSWYWADMPAAAHTVVLPPPDTTSHYFAGATGFSGESTDLRIARVARYAGVPQPLATVPNPMGTGTALRYNPSKGPWTNLSAGAHSVGTQSVAGRGALDVMREAARTEGMPAFVDRSGYLALQPSTIRQNTVPAWTVDARDLDPSTGLQDDFAYTKNQMKVTPNQQATQTVIGPAGAASQAKYGIYSGDLATASVNPIEAQSLGLSVIQLQSDPAPRMAPIVVEAATLASQAGYGPAWYDAVLATEISTPFRVTSIPAQAGGGNLDAFAEGWTETLTAGNHVFSFSTSPIQGLTAQLDDPALGRLDTDGSTLSAAASSGTTTLSLTTTGAGAVTGPVGPVALGVDGTFETGVAGWTVGVGSALASSAVAAHSGTKSGLVSAPSSSIVLFSSPDIAVTPNATYTLNLWMMLQTGTIDQASARITWYDASHILISVADSSPLATANASWVPLAVSQTAPANAAFAQAAFHAHSAATDAAYIDDVTFTAAGVAPPATQSALWTMNVPDFPVDVNVGGEQVTLTGYQPFVGTLDGSFESGVSGWSSSGSVTVAASSADHYQGTSCALLTLSGGTIGYFFPTAVPVPANTPCYLSVAFKLLSGSATVQLYGQWVSGVGFNVGTPTIGTVAATSSWQVIAGFATTSAATVTAQPTLYITGTVGAQIYVDYMVFQSSVAPQLYTVTRSVNGVVAAHPVGTDVRLWTPLTLAY